MSLADEFEAGLPSEKSLPPVEVKAQRLPKSLADEFEALTVPQAQQVHAQPLQRGDSVKQGLRDPLDAGAQMALHWLPDGVVNAVNKGTAYVNELPGIGPLTKALGMTPSTAPQLDAQIHGREQAYQASRAAGGESGIDWGRAGGNLAATLPLSAVLPASGTGLLAKTLAGASTGAATNMLNPVSEGDFNKEKGKQAALGAILGGAIAPAGEAAARFIKPNISPEVRALMDQGVTPTPGQILGGSFAKTEDKLTSVPVIGDMIRNAQRRGVDDFNVASYNRALAPIGEKSSGAVGRQGVEEVKDALSKAYNHLLPNLQFKADAQFSNEIGNLRNLINNGNVPPEIAKQYNNILQNEVMSRMTKQGAMDGVSFKQMEEALSDKAKAFAGSQNPNDRMMGDALKETLASAKRVLERSNPKEAAQLTKINEGYANYARIRDASSRLGTDSGVFTPAQLQSAVRSADKSAGKGNFATGNAFMQDLSEAGKNVLGSKYPDSGTAGRGLAAVLPALGALSFANPILGASAAIGGSAAAAPYTALGQKLAAALLAKRPDSAEAIAKAVRAGSPIIGNALVPTIGGLMQR